MLKMFLINTFDFSFNETRLFINKLINLVVSQNDIMTMSTDNEFLTEICHIFLFVYQLITLSSAAKGQPQMLVNWAIETRKLLWSYCSISESSRTLARSAELSSGCIVRFASIHRTNWQYHDSTTVMHMAAAIVMWNRF